MIRVLKFLPAFKIGGTERHVATLACGLDADRFDVHFGCTWREGEFLEAIDARGLPVTTYPIRRLYGPQTLWQQLRLAAYLRRHRIQIVHTYNFYANCFAIPAARLARTPVVVASIRDTGAFLTERQQALQRVACGMADAVLVNADAVQQWLIGQRYDSHRITVIHNGIDLARFGRPRTTPGIRQELGIPDDAPVIAMVGRVNRLKGIEYFLEAAASVAARFPDARFLIVGEALMLKDDAWVLNADYRHELEATIARLGLGGRAMLTGFRDDIPELLADVTVSVQPSLSEGLPNAVLESMAAGTPVVATRVGGTAEAVEDGVTGLVIPPRDSVAIADALVKVLQDRSWAAELGRAGRRRVAERFSRETMIRRTEELYTTLLGRAARGGARARAAASPAGPRGQDVRRRLKTAAASVLSRTGGARLLGRLAGGGFDRVLVLGYHRVVEDFDASARTTIAPSLVSRRMLEAQLDEIGRRYRFVALDDLAARLASGAPLDERVAAVTFDDGYADVYEHGLPVLERKGIPATVFVVTDLVGAPRPPVYDTLYLLLARARRARRDVAREVRRTAGALGIRLPGASGTRTFDEPFTAMRFLLTALTQSDLVRLVDALEADAPLGRADLEPHRCLTWDQALRMQRSVVTLGSHTKRHVLLTRETAEVVGDEVMDSRRRLEARLGRPVHHFAYPDGRFNPAVVLAVAGAGYRLAVTTCRHRDPGHPLLTLPRCMLWEHATVDASLRFSPAVLRCLTSGAFDQAGRCELDHHGALPAAAPLAQVAS